MIRFADSVSTDGGEGRDVGEKRFKACSLCGILVDADSPAAMESHLRAHKKNDDLKLKLLARYGPEVQRQISDLLTKIPRIKQNFF